MKKIKYVCFFLLGATALQAQSIERDVVASAGETISNGTVSLDFTVGELAVTDITNGTLTLNQGFHQGVGRLDIVVSPKVFLEGPAITGGSVTMSDALRQNSVIPTTSPYADALVANAAVFNVTGNDAIVDWVFVSLMDKNDRSVEIASTSAFLQVDGHIVKEDGVSSLEFEVDTDDYFVKITHRNHLAILTATPITLSRVDTVLDLTSDPVAVFGGASALADLGGEYAMVAGDPNQNGQIQTSDISTTLSVLGAAGYNLEDIDMNNQIQTSDINLYLRPNLGRGIQF